MYTHKIKNIVSKDGNMINVSDLIEITKDGLYYPVTFNGQVVQFFVTKEKIKEIINAFMEN